MRSVREVQLSSFWYGRSRAVHGSPLAGDQSRYVAAYVRLLVVGKGRGYIALTYSIPRPSHARVHDSTVSYRARLIPTPVRLEFLKQ